ncbi:MAG: inositol monophosphatase [bacterium]
MKSEQALMELLKELGWYMSGEIHGEVSKTPVDQLAAVVREAADDTIYKIDQEVEDRIIGFFEKKMRPAIPCLLIMEGSPEEGIAFSASGRKSDCEWTILMDPLDGTRGLMYGKRSAWMLSGAAPGTADGMTLRDITVAVQTEIAPPKQTLVDQLSAFRGKGAKGSRRSLLGGDEKVFELAPSRADSIHYGFSTFNKFFPGTKDIIVAVENELNRRLEGKAQLDFYFEDQYICNGGQLAELATGHDRFVCELRGVISPVLVEMGGKPLLCAHPYDVCTEMIAREAGVIVTDAKGEQLSAPLNTTYDIGWIGYANEKLRSLMEPPLLDILANIKSFL